MPPHRYSDTAISAFATRARAEPRRDKKGITKEKYNPIAIEQIAARLHRENTAGVGEEAGGITSGAIT